MVVFPHLHYYVNMLDLKTDCVIGFKNTIDFPSIRFCMPDLKLWSCQFFTSENDRDASSAIDREAKFETDCRSSSESGNVA